VTKTKRLTDTTSCLEEYRLHGTAQAQQRHLCVERLAKKIAGQYSSLLDPMAGIGVDAALFNAPVTLANDVDPSCRQELKTKFRWVTDYNFFNPEARRALYGLLQPDLIYLDLNNFTLAKWRKGKYRPVLDDSFAHAKRFIILNDCSVSGLRIWGHCKGHGPTFSSYSKIMGTQIGSVEDYFAAIPGFYERAYPEWRLLDRQSFWQPSNKGNGGTSYLLFQRIEP
jgi:hypothetical protein